MTKKFGELSPERFAKTAQWLDGMMRTDKFKALIPREAAALMLAALRAVDDIDGAVFHCFDCLDDEQDSGCGQLRPTLAKLALAIGYDGNPVTMDEIEEAAKLYSAAPMADPAPPSKQEG